MPRDLRQGERQKLSKARRDHALARLDLREPTVPRAAAAGPISHAVKVVDPAIQAMIEKAIAERGVRR